MQDNLTGEIPGVANRQPFEQLAAARFRFLAGLHPLPKDLQFDNAECPFDSQHQLVIKVIQLVYLLLVRDQRSKNLAHLQQPTPVLVRAGQARDFPATYDSNLAQSYQAEDALESFPAGRRHAVTATEVTVAAVHT